MALWYTEEFEGCFRTSLKVERHLFSMRSHFQQIDIFETRTFGRVLAIDGILQTSTEDEHHYHEMLVHPALCSAPSIERVLVIGGGDGGTAREVLRHPEVRSVTMVELDEEVVAACREHLPELSAGVFEDPRFSLKIGDGIAFVKEAEVEPFDVVILDGSDPVGPSEGLFGRDFYEGVRRVLKEDGIFALQSESITVYQDVFRQTVETTREVFGQSKPYFGVVPLYNAGLWSWTLAGRSLPEEIREDRAELIEEGARYYNRALHQSSFVHPAFVRRFFEEE
jgi:spermidine synthase